MKPHRTTFQKISLLMLLLATLKWRAMAFQPLQRLWKRPIFAVEHSLPPLASIHTTTNTQRKTTPKTTRTRLFSNSTTTSASSSSVDTMILPYSSPREDNLQVLYTNDPKEINRWLTENLSMDGCTIGFDTESVPTLFDHSKFSGLPVLVQMATTDSSIVIPLTHKPSSRHYNEAVVPLLVQVLEDERIVKCGVGIEGDIHDLMEYVPGMKDLKARSRLDLGLLGSSRNQIGLKTLTRIVTGRELEKPRRITISNWSKSPLTKEQVAYSARDAYAGAAIVEELGRRDPSTFGIKALIKLLRKQPSVGKVFLRKKRRKSARKELKRVQNVYRDDSAMPQKVKHKVAELKNVLKETKFELPAMEELGFALAEGNVDT